ncbi:MAG: hypothetical protein ABJM06_11450 [Gilvibacter sp.]
MKKQPFSWAAIIICDICLLVLVYFERNTYLDYQATNGKTQALYDLSDLFIINPKMYLIIGGFIGLTLSMIAWAKKESKPSLYLAILLSLTIIIAPFLNIWQWFV